MTPANPPTVIRLRAPAKLNLGLAITGRRADGFHDLVTIFQAIDLYDDVVVRYQASGEMPAAVGLGRVGAGPWGAADPGLVSDDNLAVRAARAAAESLGLNGQWTVSLEKAIPPASGMGGASSDAAAALSAVERIAGRSIPNPERAAIELALGSDVPFFRDGGTALAGGRGEDLAPLQPPTGSVFLIVTPRLAVPIPAKTATLFGALRQDDFEPGTDVLEQAGRLRAHLPLDPELLGNGFARPLGEVAPEIEPFRDELRRIGGNRWSLSGAGPTHYAVTDDITWVDATRRSIAERFRERAVVSVCRPVVPSRLH